ncbi:MAG: hypothetical protein OXI27_10015 [Thaumarchaeota archaeon]|nr:hypothetical protein [Nitrososphaerota archaeon]
MVARGWTKYATVDWKKVVAAHAMRVPIRNLRELLWEEALADGNTRERFERWARGECRDVRFEADTRIASEMQHGFVPDYNTLDLYDIKREAETVWRDRPEMAERVYMGLTESLGVHYNMMDDSYGTFWPLFEECIKDMGDCIKRQNLAAEDRRRRIDYLAYWSLVVFTDFMVYYENLLAELCADAEDFDVWRGVLEDELRDDDIEDRGCYWAVDKAGIEEALSRVLEMRRGAL